MNRDRVPELLSVPSHMSWCVMEIVMWMGSDEGERWEAVDPVGKRI